MDNSQENQTSTPEKIQSPAHTQPNGESTPPAEPDLGTYNRESGKKTLVFVCALIAIIAVLSILSIFMIYRKSTVKVLPQTIENQAQTANPTIAPSPTLTEDTVEEELNSLDMSDPDSEIQDLEKEANQL